MKQAIIPYFQVVVFIEKRLHNYHLKAYILTKLTLLDQRKVKLWYVLYIVCVYCVYMFQATVLLFYHADCTPPLSPIAASTRYLVSVEAVSGVGCSDVTEIDCYTEQTQPPVVTGVTVDRLNGTAMNVSWTPLNKAQSNGFIQSYIVTYSVVTATPNRKRQGSQQVTVSSDKSGTIIGGLDPGSEYSVGVSASGAGGTSQCELSCYYYYY